MNGLNSYCRIITMAAVLLLLTTMVAFSGQSGDIGHVDFYDDALQLSANGSVKNSTIKISGPNGFFYEEDFIDGTIIPIDWMEAVEEGFYKYEITGASTKKIKNRKMKMNNGRNYEPDTVNIRKYQSGGFRIENGMIVDSNAAEEKE